MKFTADKLKESPYFWKTPFRDDTVLYNAKDGIMAVTLATEERDACRIESIGVLYDEKVIRVYHYTGGFEDYPIDSEIEITMLRSVWEEIPE